MIKIENITDENLPPNRHEVTPPYFETREDRINMARKLRRAKELCNPIVKDKTGHGFRYASPAQATANGSAACIRAGLAAIAKVMIVNNDLLSYQLELIDEDTGYSIKFPSPLIPIVFEQQTKNGGRKLDPAHAIRTATTYAEKMAWCAALTIPQFTDQDSADAQAEALAEKNLYITAAKQDSANAPGNVRGAVGSPSEQTPANPSQAEDIKKALGIKTKKKTKTPAGWTKAQQAQKAIKQEAIAILSKPGAEILFKGLVLAKDAPESWEAVIEEARQRLEQAKAQK